MNIFKNWFKKHTAGSGTVDIESCVKLIDNLSDGDQLIIFKASSICASSMFIEKHFDEWYQKHKSDNLKMLKVDVIAQRPLSNFIAERYNIKHESPQLICLDHEENILWHGSHGSITMEVLDELLLKHSK